MAVRRSISFPFRKGGRPKHLPEGPPLATEPRGNGHLVYVTLLAFGLFAFAAVAGSAALLYLGSPAPVLPGTETPAKIITVELPPEILSPRPLGRQPQVFARNVSMLAAELCRNALEAAAGSAVGADAEITIEPSICYWMVPLPKMAGETDTPGNAVQDCPTGQFTGTGIGTTDLIEMEELVEETPDCHRIAETNLFFNARSTDSTVRLFRFKLNADPASQERHLDLLADIVRMTFQKLAWGRDEELEQAIRAGRPYDRGSVGVYYWFKQEHGSPRFNLVVEIPPSPLHSLKPFVLNSPAG